jgi:hypothetical protein
MSDATFTPGPARKLTAIRRFQLWLKRQYLSYLLMEKAFEAAEIDRTNARIDAIQRQIKITCQEISSLNLKK